MATHKAGGSDPLSADRPSRRGNRESTVEEIRRKIELEKAITSINRMHFHKIREIYEGYLANTIQLKTAERSILELVVAIHHNARSVEFTGDDVRRYEVCRESATTLGVTTSRARTLRLLLAKGLHTMKAENFL